MNDALDHWKDLFISVCDKHCPVVTRRVRKTFLPWIDADIKEEIRLKHYYQHKAKTKHLHIFWDLFKHYRNSVSNMMKSAKKTYYTDMILNNKHKPRVMWKYIRELLPGKSKTSPHGLLEGGNLITDIKMMANCFNNFFTSIGRKLADKIPNAALRQQQARRCDSSFKFPKVTSEFVLKQLNNLPTNKAIGLDGISGRLLKHAGSAICTSLTYIMNQSLSQAKFPTDWKQAKVIPIFKSGSPNETNNYRPISILPILSKIMEKFVHYHFSQFLENNNLLTLAQSGFRRLHSTLTSLIQCTDRWLRNIDKGLITGVVFIDLRKAFDTVNFEILLQKLQEYGVNGSELEWFSSYLHGRSQVVTIDGVLSESLPVTVGVPQGSILGPLLFVLYVNDLPEALDNCESNMYADDTEIEHATKPCDSHILETALNDDMGKLKEYFIQNKLSLNVPKCTFMLIGTHQSLAKCESITIRIGECVLEQVKSSKYLGMQVDENLKWDSHIDTLRRKLASKVGLLKRLRRIIPNETLLQLYKSIVLPHFDYCDIIYGTCSKQNLDMLQKLQNRAARILTGSGPRAHRNDMYKQLGMLSLSNRQILHKCILVFKSLNNLTPDYLDVFTQNNNIHMHNTRTSQRLHTATPRTAYYAKSFEISGAIEYNNLPYNITTISSLNQFKSAVYKYLARKDQF